MCSFAIKLTGQRQLQRCGSRSPLARSIAPLQAEVLLGSKADDLAQVREQEETRFAAVMRERVWQEYVLRVKAQAQ